MKKRIKLALTLCGILFMLIQTTGCTVKQIQGVSRSISVSGTGVVTVIPDKATIVLAVETSNKDVVTASKENADKMTQVQAALVEAGIVKEDISTTNYSINQDVSWNNGKKILGGYQVSNQVVAIIRNIDATGSIIDKAISAGANELSSITFGVSDTEKSLKQARILAIKNAEETATLLANTSGAEIGKVITISENTNSNLTTLPMMVKANAWNDAATTPISAGKKEITVTVFVTYTLQ